MKNIKGFTLIELIIVIAIISLLAAATFVAVNPARRVGNAQDATRYQDLMAIADAYQTYLADNNSTPPTNTSDGTTYMIATTTPTVVVSPASCDSTTTPSRFVVLDTLVSTGYIGQIPLDPAYSYTNNTYSSMYWMYHETSGKLKLGACKKYGDNYPSVTR